MPFGIRNTTRPVGLPLDDDTVAVKVTGFPDTEGLGVEVSVTAEFVFSTVYIAEDVL